jgi:hypothetical protein
MNEAIGGAQNGHRYDQSFEEGNERCHDDTIHAPRPRHRPRTVYHMSQKSPIALCATIRRPTWPQTGIGRTKKHVVDVDSDSVRSRQSDIGSTARSRLRLQRGHSKLRTQSTLSICKTRRSSRGLPQSSAPSIPFIIPTNAMDQKSLEIGPTVRFSLPGVTNLKAEFFNESGGARACWRRVEPVRDIRASTLRHQLNCGVSASL